MSIELPTHARLYYTGGTRRRYLRASTQPGPGEPLCLKSAAQEAISQAAAAERAKGARLRALVLELAAAVENAADDIGGSRAQLDILREAVKAANA